MRAAPVLVFPSSRILAGWWSQLASCQPRLVWVAHLHLHRVEALARIRQSAILERFDTFLLNALAMSSPTEVNDLESRLQLGTAVVLGALRALARRGLVEPREGHYWTLTDAGRAALVHGVDTREVWERRPFHFFDRTSSGQKPYFLRLSVPATAFDPSLESWSFNPALLSECVAQPSEWKRHHGFPEDVEEIVGPERAPLRPRWDSVIVDRAEHLFVVFAQVQGGGEADAERLLGFAADTRIWSLRTEPAALTLGADWREVFPCLTFTVNDESWRGAWLGWAEFHGLPTEEVEACSLRYEEGTLQIQPTAALAERVAAGKCPALATEPWLLAGQGAIRSLARLQITP